MLWTLWTLSLLSALIQFLACVRREAPLSSFAKSFLFLTATLLLSPHLSLHQCTLAYASLTIGLGVALTFLMYLLLKSPKQLFLKTVSLTLFGVLVFFCWGMQAFFVMNEERPVLKVALTGKIELKQLEWKAPQGSLEKRKLPHYEVVLKSVDDEVLFSQVLCGELVAIRARVFRFTRLFNTLGFSSRYQFELLYNGYNDAQSYNRLPIQAFSIAELSRHTFWHKFFWKMWSGAFMQQQHFAWLKSATLESNYFPLVDANQRPIVREFLITISSGGLSAIPSS